MSSINLQTTRGRLVLAAAIFASGMAFLDGSIVTVALPRLQTVFGLSLAGIQWVVNGYTLALSALILTAGALGDKYGHRRVFSIGIALFTLGSAFCGLAPTGSYLIAARIFQGIGGAFMVPGSLTIIRTNFPEKEQGKAIGYWAGLSGGIAALGPFLGGLIVTSFDWRWVFLINVPLGIAAYILTEKVVPKDTANHDQAIDWWGTGSIVVALGALCIGLIQGEATHWGMLSVVSLGIGTLAGAAFLAIELRATQPMVPQTLFKIPTVLGANIATLFIYGALSAAIFFLALNFQQLQGYRADQAGLALLPPILLITFLSGPLGGLSNRFGLKKPLVLGTLLVGIGMALLAAAGIHQSYWTAFLPGLMLFGIGMAFVISPITQAALTVQPDSIGAASGVNNAVARFAGLLAIAVLSAVAAGQFAHELANRPALITNDSRQLLVAQADKFGEAQVPTSVIATDRSAGSDLIQASLQSSFRIALSLASVSVFFASFILLVLIPNTSSRKE